MLLDREVAEVRPNSSALNSKALREMPHHLREARRYLQGVYCHELGDWQMKTPLYAQAICKCCSIAHHAFITIEGDKIIKQAGCNYGLVACRVSKEGKAKSKQFYDLLRANNSEFAETDITAESSEGQSPDSLFEVAK